MVAVPVQSWWAEEDEVNVFNEDEDKGLGKILLNFAAYWRRGPKRNARVYHDVGPENHWII